MHKTPEIETSWRSWDVLAPTIALGNSDPEFNSQQAGYMAHRGVLTPRYAPHVGFDCGTQSTHC